MRISYLELDDMLNIRRYRNDKDAIVKDEDIAMEECSELIKAISKCVREKIDPNEYDEETKKIHYDNLCEEIADVYIAISRIKHIEGVKVEDLNKWLQFKQTRQMLKDYMQMIDESGNENNPSYEKGGFKSSYYIQCSILYHNMTEEERAKYLK